MDGRWVATIPNSRPEGEPGLIPALSDFLHQHLNRASTHAVGEVDLAVDPDTPSWLLASVLWTGSDAGARRLLVQRAERPLALHVSSAINRWIEPEPGHTDVILLLGQTRITVVWLKEEIKPENAGIEFDTIERQAAASDSYPILRAHTRKACEGAAGPCPRAVQLQTSTGLSSGEWIALLDAATSWDAPVTRNREVSVAMITPAPTNRTARVPTILFHRIIDRQKASFRKCYDDAVGGDLTAIGRVVMKLTIGATGAVSEVSDVTEPHAGSTLEGRPSAARPLRNMVARQCIASQYSRLRFPPPPDGTLVFTWPMFFSPGPREQVSEELQ